MLMDERWPPASFYCGPRVFWGHAASICVEFKVLQGYACILSPSFFLARILPKALKKNPFCLGYRSIAGEEVTTIGLSRLVNTAQDGLEIKTHHEPVMTMTWQILSGSASRERLSWPPWKACCFMLFNDVSVTSQTGHLCWGEMCSVRVAGECSRAQVSPEHQIALCSSSHPTWVTIKVVIWKLNLRAKISSGSGMLWNVLLFSRSGER